MNHLLYTYCQNTNIHRLSLLGGSSGRALEVHTSSQLPWAGAGGSDSPKRLLDTLTPMGTCPVPEYRHKPEDKRFTLKRHPGGKQTAQYLGTSCRGPDEPRSSFKAAASKTEEQDRTVIRAVDKDCPCTRTRTLFHTRSLW